MSKCMELLAIATTAIRDLHKGYPEKEIAAPSGTGVEALLRELVTYLRENGVDDEGGWGCDATEGIEVKRLPEFEPFKLIVEAYACDEFGDGPAYAVVTVDQPFLDKLVRFSRVCQENGLKSVTGDVGPDRWDGEDELRLRGDSLQVYGDSFWFTAYPKHASYNVETRNIEIGDLLDIAEAGPGAPVQNDCFRWSDGRLYYASDPGLVDDLIDMIEESESSEDCMCDDCGAEVSRIIGCPDGAEICQRCFDAGNH